MSWDQVWTAVKAFLAEVWAYCKSLWEKAVQAVAAALEAGAEIFWAELAKAVAKLAKA